MMRIFANVYETKTVLHLVTKTRYTHISLTEIQSNGILKDILEYLIIFISYSHIIISHTCTDEVKFYYYFLLRVMYFYKKLLFTANRYFHYPLWDVNLNNE